MAPEFNEHGLVRHKYPDGKVVYIPWRQVHIIRKQLRRGVPFHALSPLYPVTREEVAMIMLLED